MLKDFYSDKIIDQVPFAKDYKAMMDRMNDTEIHAIKAKLNSMIDGSTIQTAGWMPGDDWTDTVFQPIHDKAAKRNPEIAAKCFGLIVWEVFMERDELWCSERFEKNGEPIGSRTYFRVD